ncbi:MAG: hypothetical protein COB89_07410 [Piscirickettsiaceae bacterium]|nr:MAG: hypothetical protein COB89_07755 [Piscirickettsiaceae bacterium]PCH83269.1 MAG: hypothetical protein COB89_07410 [Piscirickettsiaceae bacterium]
MNPRVNSVEALQENILKLSFENDEVKLFDASPFLDKGISKELQNYSYFKQVAVTFGSVGWPNEQDFSNDTLYLLSTPLER